MSHAISLHIKRSNCIDKL